MTPTVDYFHDLLLPWTHYIPVSSDLRDLKRKFQWAESHPVEAKKIADRSSKLIKYLTSEEGFQDLFQQDMVEPLKRVIEAYQPVSTLPPHKKAVQSNDWREVVKQIDPGAELVSIVSCGGNYMHDCKRLQSKQQLRNMYSRHSKDLSGAN